MTTTALRKKIHQYVDASDDKILKVVHTILEEHSKLKMQHTSALSEKDIKELDARWAEYKKGKAKMFNLNEVSRDVSKNLKTLKR